VQALPRGKRCPQADDAFDDALVGSPSMMAVTPATPSIGGTRKTVDSANGSATLLDVPLAAIRSGQRPASSAAVRSFARLARWMPAMVASCG
jgi:hypothetical protein